MTKKDYNRAAKIVAIVEPKERVTVCAVFTVFFSENPAFNADRFAIACGIGNLGALPSAKAKLR